MAEAVTFRPMPKSRAVRSGSYRRYVASLPCCECRLEGYSQAAHPNFGRGLGQKASDADVFPLCATRYMEPGCHQRHDQCIGMDLQERRRREAIYTLQTQAQAARDGWTFVSGVPCARR